jgi:GNAT superfamily N-acetyltransferase
MDLACFKRFRMETTLAGRDLSPMPVQSGYRLIPWQDSLLDAFARAKYLSFRHEMDVALFPCLADFEGCQRLMKEIVRKPGFLPEATWLAVHATDRGLSRHGKTDCGAGVSPALCGPDGCTTKSRRGAGTTTAWRYCGAVQGVRERNGLGAIQNLGVAHEHRQRGLGESLLLHCLAGFRQAGVCRVYLEVTAQNAHAIRLYRRLGFITTKIVYKAVEAAYSP